MSYYAKFWNVKRESFQLLYCRFHEVADVFFLWIVFYSSKFCTNVEHFWRSSACKDWKRVIQVAVSYFFHSRELGFLDWTWISSDFFKIYYYYKLFVWNYISDDKFYTVNLIDFFFFAFIILTKIYMLSFFY